MKNKKIRPAVWIGLLVLFWICVGTFIVITIKNTFFDSALVSNKIAVEYGSPLSFSKESLFKEKYLDQVDVYDVDTSQALLEGSKEYARLQEFTATVTWTQNGKLNNKDIVVQVKDTQAPLLLSSEIVVPLGDPDYDYKNGLNYQEFSSYSVDVDDSSVSYNKAGTYSATVTAVDALGNTSTDYIRVRVSGDAADFRPVTEEDEEEDSDKKSSTDKDTEEKDTDSSSSSKEKDILGWNEEDENSGSDPSTGTDSSSSQSSNTNNSSSNIGDNSSSSSGSDFGNNSSSNSSNTSSSSSGTDNSNSSSSINSGSNTYTEPDIVTSTDGSPDLVNGIPVVNKKHGVSADYAPGENAVAGEAARALIAEMQSLGYDISSSYSGYRSYSYQSELYNNYVAAYGQAEADTFSARPGYSEHQTGLAFDLKHSDGSLVTGTAEANWIAENAWRYGFIVRYQEDKESITGYQAEPWHIRYIGDEAKAIYDSGLCLEEYLGIEGGDYQ